jgi:hypothetical protein
MVAALQGTDIATASQFLKGATDATLRRRLLPKFLDREGRISRNAEGKDWNWLIESKELMAQSYNNGDPLTFANTNLNVQATVTPNFYITTSAMNITDILMNTGPVIVNNYLRRGVKMARAMQNKFHYDMYSTASSNPNSMLGFGNLVNYTTCTNGDRVAVPAGGATYAGLNMSLGFYGGSWSNNIATAYQMNRSIGYDWPDGQSTLDNSFDIVTPRYYNENTNCWETPGATPAAGNWNTNCLLMLSRANTDLDMNTVEAAMPNIHLGGSGRMQAVKDALRVSFRDTYMSNKPAEMLGYYKAMNYEGAAIDVDYQCPADRTYSLCAASMEIFFYGEPAGTDGGRQKLMEAGVGQDSGAVTGGIFTTFGPERPPGSVDWVWIMFAGGQTRYYPKWFAVHKDFTS